jgi:hypothetical protein
MVIYGGNHLIMGGFMNWFSTTKCPIHDYFRSISSSPFFIGLVLGKSAEKP